MTSAVLYGTTSDNELRPVQVTDSGEFVTDGGGGGDWYENFYVGGTEGAPSISLLSAGSISTVGSISPGPADVGLYIITESGDSVPSLVPVNPTSPIYSRSCHIGSTARPFYSANFSGDVTAIGDVYASDFIPSNGYSLAKIGQALSTIYDVIDSVDDLQGLKNLFHLLLDNLKSDPTPPRPPQTP